MEKLLQITAPHFCAGIILKDDKAYKSAPILKYMIGWNAAAIVGYCTYKRWKVKEVKDDKVS